MVSAAAGHGSRRRRGGGEQRREEEGEGEGRRGREGTAACLSARLSLLAEGGESQGVPLLGKRPRGEPSRRLSYVCLPRSDQPLRQLSNGTRSGQRRAVGLESVCENVAG